MAYFVLSRPEFAAPPPLEDRSLVARLFVEVRRYEPPISSQDAAGLVVLRLTNEFWPEGRTDTLGAQAANVQGLSLANAIAPLEMRAAGFAPPRVLHANAAPHVLMAYAHAARARWIEWYQSSLDPYRRAETERHECLHWLAKKHCLRPAVDPTPAAREASKRLDAFFARRGLGPAGMTPEDVLSELHLLEPGEIGRRGILHLRSDGRLHFDAKRMRDPLRSAKRAGLPTAEMTRALPAETHGPARAVEAAEQLAALRGKVDQVDQLIIDHWHEPNVKLAELTGRTPQRIGQRKKALRWLAERLNLDQA